MILFGHLGIGGESVRMVTKSFRLRWLLLGTMLPDLIDKPLYYGLCALSGQEGLANGVICGTRTIGHTALFLAVLWVVAAVTDSLAMTAVAAGASTHWILDAIADFSTTHHSPLASPVLGGSRAFQAFFYPYPEAHFPISHLSFEEHLWASLTPSRLAFEVVGAIPVAWWIREAYKHRKARKSAGHLA